MRNYRQIQSGGSLIEVLVSVLVLGLGILGITAVQTTALHSARYSFELSQAAHQAQAILDVMRSRRSDVQAGHYHTGGFVCHTHTGNYIGHWIEDVQNALGKTACGEIACRSGGAWCQVKIRWGDAPSQTDKSIPHELTAGAQL